MSAKRTPRMFVEAYAITLAICILRGWTEEGSALCRYTAKEFSRTAHDRMKKIAWQMVGRQREQKEKP